MEKKSIRVSHTEELHDLYSKENLTEEDWKQINELILDEMEANNKLIIAEATEHPDLLTIREYEEDDIVVFPVNVGKSSAQKAKEGMGNYLKALNDKLGHHKCRLVVHPHKNGDAYYYPLVLKKKQ